MPKGRIEDLLQLGMKTEPPVMRGIVTMKARLHIPPGKVRVAQKLGLAGNLSIQNVEFNNAHVQDRVDGLSLRAQGKPKDVKGAETDNRPEVSSQMDVTFSLSNALMTMNSLKYQIPGAKVNDGWRLLDGRQSLRVQGACPHRCDGIADGDRMEVGAADAVRSAVQARRSGAGAADLHKRDEG